jgi:hypothetical protein
VLYSVVVGRPGFPDGWSKEYPANESKASGASYIGCFFVAIKIHIKSYTGAVEILWISSTPVFISR